jgi:ATP-dependent Lhr-like helicase
MRFLFRWQRVEPGTQAAGPEGLAAVLGQLDGYELPAVAWELDVLPARCEGYGPELLDALSLGGRVAWGRLTPSGGEGGSGPLRTSPVALFLREHARFWLDGRPDDAPAPSSRAGAVLEVLERRGASFFQELVAATGLLPTRVEEVLGELAGLGLVSSDGIAGLRALLTPSDRRPPPPGGRRRGRVSPYSVDAGGRWACLREAGDRANDDPDAALEAIARVLLRRYGVVFRTLLAGESRVPSWRDLARVYRRMEARGELRGGRFVAGVTGEQFALPEAVTVLRRVRRETPSGDLLGISAADPLNLTGVITPGARVPAVVGNRVVYRDGVPVAARIAGELRALGDVDGTPGADLSGRSAADPLRTALRRKPAPRSLRTLEKGLKL